MAQDVGFMELVEIHERRWGTKGYPGRPTLKEIMECPIIAVWSHAGGFTLSAHESPEHINQVVTHLFTETSLDNRRLVKIFYNREVMPFTLQVVRVKETPPEAARQDDPPPAPRRFTDIKEVGPARYGQSAPARNQLLPGRKSRHFKGR